MDIFRRTLARVGMPLLYAGLRLPVKKARCVVQESMHWTGKERQKWRLARLQTMLLYCWNTVPFYKTFWSDHHITDPHISSIEELSKFPVLTKALFKENVQLLIPTDLHKIRYQKKHSGGTTGIPIHYNQDLEQWAFMQSFHEWAWSLTGYRLGDSFAMIGGGSLLPNHMKIKVRLKNFLEHRTFLFGLQINRELAIQYHKILTAKKIRYIYGYPSFLFLFTTYLREAGLTLPFIRGVVTNGDMLSEQFREGIESFFQKKVFNNLGANDGGYESYECSLHTGFHYNDLQSVLEVIAPDTHGFGNLVITNLWNKSTPFIRYENGDCIKLGKTSCACGIPFPLIDAIAGRSAEILTFANGRSLTGPALRLIFAKVPEVLAWQAVQKSTMQIQVRILPHHSIASHHYDYIRSVLVHHLTDAVKVEILNVDKVDTTQGGKLKHMWSDVVA